MRMIRVAQGRDSNCLASTYVQADYGDEQAMNREVTTSHSHGLFLDPFGPTTWGVRHMADHISNDWRDELACPPLFHLSSNPAILLKSAGILKDCPRRFLCRAFLTFLPDRPAWTSRSNDRLTARAVSTGFSCESKLSCR